MCARLSARVVFAVGLVVGLIATTGITPVWSQDASPSADVVVTLVNRVGDNDNFHGGDAADIPRRSVEIVQALSKSETPPVELDEGGSNRLVGFTHAFDLPKGATIVGAVLRLRIRSDDPLFFNDTITFNEGVLALAVTGQGFPTTPFRYLLGFEPVTGETYDLNIDLSNVPVLFSCPTCTPGGHFPENPDAFVNLLSDLENGQLNVIIADDTNVDFSTFHSI
jgi:hypothetical protein